jgi:hypothetical protein
MRGGETMFWLPGSTQDRILAGHGYLSYAAGRGWARLARCAGRSGSYHSTAVRVTRCAGWGRAAMEARLTVKLPDDLWRRASQHAAAREVLGGLGQKGVAVLLPEIALAEVVSALAALMTQGWRPTGLVRSAGHRTSASQRSVRPSAT